jgi:hypothetical protein
MPTGNRLIYVLVPQLTRHDWPHPKPKPTITYADIVSNHVCHDGRGMGVTVDR